MIKDKIRDLRRKKNISQKELSQAINIAQSTLACYETGKREPDLEILKKLANFFNVTTDYLLDNTEETYNVNKVIFYTKSKGNEKLDDLTEEQLNLLIQFAKQMKNKE